MRSGLIDPSFSSSPISPRCGHRRPRRLLPIRHSGLQAAHGAPSRNARAQRLRHADRHLARRAARSVDRAAPAQRRQSHPACGLPHRRGIADIPDRYRPYSRLFGLARMAAVVRSRHDGGARPQLDHRAPYRERTQGARAAEPYPRSLPDDADHAPRARRDAGSAAHRLHQVCTRPRIAGARPSTTITRCATRSFP